MFAYLHRNQSRLHKGPLRIVQHAPSDPNHRLQLR
jgi:hypothetical protein